MRLYGEDGQASIELVGLLLVVSLALGALASVTPRVDGRSIGGFLAHHVVCAATGGCRAAERELERAYGQEAADAVRELAPNLVYEPGERQLPVDWRDCRRPRCASAPDDPTLDSHSSEARARATAFTHVIRRNGRLYVQYGSTTRTRTAPWPGQTASGSGHGSCRACASCWRARPPTPAFTATTGRASSSAWIPTAAHGCERAPTVISRAASGADARTSGCARRAGCASRAAATRDTCRSGWSRERPTPAADGGAHGSRATSPRPAHPRGPCDRCR